MPRTSPSSTTTVDDGLLPNPHPGEILQLANVLLLTPTEAWDEIAQETSSVDLLIRRYIVPLALLAPVATVVGMKTFDASWSPAHGYLVPPEAIWSAGATTLFASIVSIFVLAVWVMPKFKDLFNSLDAKLPLVTRILKECGLAPAANTLAGKLGLLALKRLEVARAVALDPPPGKAPRIAPVNVASMFVPVSPSGTGKTLRASIPPR